MPFVAVVVADDGDDDVVADNDDDNHWLVLCRHVYTYFYKEEMLYNTHIHGNFNSFLIIRIFFFNFVKQISHYYLKDV